MRFALVSVFVAVSALSVGCAVDANEDAPASAEDEVSAAEALSAGVAEGQFVLHTEANHVADPECDSFTDLTLKSSGRAELADRLTGRCALVALFDANPRAFTLRQKPGSCGSKVFEGMRRVALGPATTGLAKIKITDHRSRLCKDVVPATLVVEESMPGPNGFITKKLFSQRSVAGGPSASPLPPDFCADGRIETEPGYIASSNGMECSIPRVHCVTKDSSSCPQLSPPSPDFCKDGRRVAGPPSYIASADGKECRMPSLHCVTNDNSACPQLSPPSPDFCKDGTIKSEPNFIPSADGMECSIPSLHCVTKDQSACPMF